MNRLDKNGNPSVFSPAILHPDHGVRAVRKRRAGHDPRGLSRADPFCGHIPRGDLFDHLQPDGILLPGPFGIPRAEGIAVHRRAILRRDRPVTADILSDHPSGAFEDIDIFQAEKPLPGFLSGPLQRKSRFTFVSGDNLTLSKRDLSVNSEGNGAERAAAKCKDYRNIRETFPLE